MYTIEIEKECSCVKKSGMEKITTYETREDMVNKARVLECLMNQNFCMTHFFEAVDYDDKIVIHSSLRPEDDDEDDHIEDARDLINRGVVQIGFDASEAPPKDSGGN